MIAAPDGVRYCPRPKSRSRLAAPWTLWEANCCLAELIANCSKWTVLGTQRYLVDLRRNW